MLAELPDLWDVNLSTWPNDSQTSRFAKEGFQEEYTSFVKQVTSKPVVGVGRFTSPYTMVGQVKRGVTPETNAVATMILGFTVFTLLFAQLVLYLQGRRVGSGGSMAKMITER